MAIVLTPSVVGCSTDDTYLPALLADPMASYGAQGIELIDAWEYAEGMGPLGKPVVAQVGRIYHITDQDQADEVLSEAAEFAELVGWRMTPPITTPADGYGGAKELDVGSARLGVSLVAADPLHDLEGPRVLTVRLDFGPVRFDDSTTTTLGG